LSFLLGLLSVAASAGALAMAAFLNDRVVGDIGTDRLPWVTVAQIAAYIAIAWMIAAVAFKPNPPAVVPFNGGPQPVPAPLPFEPFQQEEPAPWTPASPTQQFNTPGHGYPEQKP
jgi:hypothetical protein